MDLKGFCPIELHFHGEKINKKNNSNKNNNNNLLPQKLKLYTSKFQLLV